MNAGGTPDLVVAIFGRAPDPTTRLAAPLLEQGATVVLCLDWTPFEGPPDPEEQGSLAELCCRFPGQALLLTGLDGEQFAYAFMEGRGPGRFVAWARRSFGRLDAVVLGNATGYGARDPALAFARALGRSGGEVLAVEADAVSADDVVRWVARDPRITAVRPSSHRARRREAIGLGRVARLLNDAGCVTPISLADADRQAAPSTQVGSRSDRRTAVAPDRLRRFESGSCAVVTVRSLASAQRPIYPSVDWPDAGVTPLQSLGVDGVVVSVGQGLGSVEIARTGAVAYALRASSVADAFATDDPYTGVGEWQPSTADVVVGSAYRVLERGEGVRVRLRRHLSWRIDLATVDGELTDRLSHVVPGREGRRTGPSSHSVPLSGTTATSGSGGAPDPGAHL